MRDRHFMGKEIGAVIRRLRDEREMSLGVLAGVMGYPKGGDPTGLQRIEAGDKRVYLDLYLQIADAFGIPFSEILREAEGKGDATKKVLSPKEEKTIGTYLALNEPGKAALDYLIAAAAAGEQKTGDDPTP